MNAKRVTKWTGLVAGLLLAATPAWAGTTTRSTTVTRTNTTRRPLHVRAGEVNYTTAGGRHYEAEGVVVTRGRPVSRTTTVEKQTTLIRGR
jgi:hypothetical protein